MRLFSLNSPSLRRLAGALALTAILSPAFALPVMEMRAEDFLPMAADLKKQLNLNANQTILWQRTESKTRVLLRERQQRRERLQAKTQDAVLVSGVELREVNKAIEEESAASFNEEKLLREWWLTVNDSLSESQRTVVAQLVSEQLLRVADNGGGHSGGEPRKDDGGGRQGGRKGGGGGMGGGGMGVGVGTGGASINLPGGGGE